MRDSYGDTGSVIGGLDEVSDISWHSDRGTLKEFLNVGAAEGCDLLMLLLKTRSKDRSLRQLLQRTGQLVRHAAAVQHSVDHQFTEHDYLMQHQHRPALWVVDDVANIAGHVAGGG